MSDRSSRLPWRRTEELPAAGRPSRSTQPMPAGSAHRRPGGRPPLAWVVVAVLAALLVFFLGFLAGRSGESAPEAQSGSGKTRACIRAATLSARVTRLHRQALANRAGFARALGRGDEVEIAALDSQLRELSTKIGQVSAKARNALERCQG